MFLKLEPDQAVMYWEDLKKVLEETVPIAGYEADDKWANMQRALMVGDMQAWVGVTDTKLQLVIITNYIYDAYTQVKSLQIYGLKGLDRLTDVMYTKAALVLRAWAVENKCQRFVGFTANERLIQIAKKLFNADVSYHFVDIPLV